MSESPASAKLTTRLYNSAYRLGLSPWDVGPPKPELVELIEGSAALPAGQAADLGCGAGTKSVYLAEHGWKVTGFDISPPALRQARKKAADKGVDIEFIRYDLTKDPRSVTGKTFDFLLDIGCCHSLGSAGKASYARGIAGIAETAATLFLFGFTKGPLSVTQQDIDTFFEPYWDLVSATPGSERRTPDAGPMWYLLRRKAAQL
jgi:SAM-dependent methyltransferase